jgi:putative transposase
VAVAADGADDTYAALSGLLEAQREQALARWRVLRAHLEDGCPLVRVAAVHAVPERTLRRWLTAYRAGGLVALARRPRSDRGRRRMPPELQLLIEGLALRRPPPTVATVHRQAAEVAREQGGPVPGYAAVYDVVRSIDPAMATLAHEGAKRYKEVFDLVHRRETDRPNEIWQADHTLLDLWVLTPSGRPGRPWLTLIEDDHSRAVAGYAVNLGAPSALTTALAFRQAIWCKPWPGWHVCGIPDAFHVDKAIDPSRFKPNRRNCSAPSPRPCFISRSASGPADPSPASAQARSSSMSPPLGQQIGQPPGGGPVTGVGPGAQRVQCGLLHPIGRSDLV